MLFVSEFSNRTEAATSGIDIGRLHISGILVLLLTGCGSPADTAGFNGVEVEQVARLDRQVDESSGLARWGGFFWTINDSGNSAEVFKLDAEGRLLSATPISNATNVDWESLAQDDRYLYIADTGNNFNSRQQFTIYRVAWSALESGTARAEKISFSFTDYLPGNSRSHNFDSEALAVRGDELWLFTKNRGDGMSNLYRIPAQPGEYEVASSQSLPVLSLVTGADINPETAELVLISYGGGRFEQQFNIWLAPTSNEGVNWEQVRSSLALPLDQWEAVVWNGDAEILLSHENSSRGFAGIGRLLTTVIQ